ARTRSRSIASASSSRSGAGSRSDVVWLSVSAVSQPGSNPAKNTDGRSEYTRSRVSERQSASRRSIRPSATMTALSAPDDDPAAARTGTPRSISAPAAWAAREQSLLAAVSYAPAADGKVAELGKRFSKLAGASVRLDHIQSVQMSAKLSSQLMSRSGHDIISLEMHYPWLFAPGLVD